MALGKKKNRVKVQVTDIEPIERLTADLKTAARDLKPSEIRYLVDGYYGLQEWRKATGNQIDALEKSGEPHFLIDWLHGQSDRLENQIKAAMDIYAHSNDLGRWSTSIMGIGPVLASGLQSHLDITRTLKATQLWRFAGLDPSVEWLGREKAATLVRGITGDAREVTDEMMLAIEVETQRKATDIRALAKLEDDHHFPVTSLIKALSKRPWNASLKTLCWKVGESFVYQQHREDDVYGKLFFERKFAEWQRNVNGEYSDTAQKVLTARRIGHDTDAYPWYSGQWIPKPGWYLTSDQDQAANKVFKRGGPGAGVQMLPPAHIHARARRWVTKLFLSHFHAVAFELHYKRPAPRPFVIDHLGHQDFVPIPNWPMAAG